MSAGSDLTEVFEWEFVTEGHTNMPINNTFSYSLKVYFFLNRVVYGELLTDYPKGRKKK